jgi:flagellar hook-associated protein 3 FlgL
MRVTDSYRYEVFKNSLSILKERLAKTEEMIASEKKILAPSDDPVGTSQYMQLKAQKETNSQYVKNIQQLSTLGGTYETAANGVSEILAKAKELATTMASDTQDASTRQTAAGEVESLIEQLVTVGNSRVGSTYVFGGKKSDVTAFTLNDVDYSVTFNGSNEVSKVQIATGQTENMGISGEKFFGTAAGSTNNIFAALKDLRDALNNNDRTAIGASLDGIDNAVDLAANDLSYVGTYTNKITSFSDTMTNNNIGLQTVMASIMDVDTVQAYTDYTTLTNAYEASLSVINKMQSMNILDYLR